MMTTSFRNRAVNEMIETCRKTHLFPLGKFVGIIVFWVPIVFSMCSSMFQIMFFKGTPKSTTLLSLMVCPKFSPSHVYI
jgi:hypothetical protein